MDASEYEVSAILFDLTNDVGKLNAFMRKEDELREKRLIRAMEETLPEGKENQNELFRKSQELRRKFNPHL